jgi:hypothetical protein
VITQVPRGFFQHSHHPVGAFHFHLADALLDGGQVFVAFALEAFAYLVVVHRHRHVAGIDAVEAPGGQAILCQCPLPGRHHFLRIVLPRRIVDLIEYVEELGGIRARHGLRHQVLEGIAHGARLRMAGIEEHQHQVGQIDDVADDVQRRRALLVGVEPRRVDEDLAAQRLRAAGLQLQVGIHAPAVPLGDLFYVVADLVEGQARVAVQGQAGQHRWRVFGAVADHREFVVHRLIAGALQLLPGVLIEKRGLARGKGSQHGDDGPPGHLGGIGVIVTEQAQATGYPVELLIASHHTGQNGVFLLEMRFEALHALLAGGLGHVASVSSDAG